MIKLYLDIDGVLLSKRGKNIPDGLGDFLRFAVTHFNCYWLTTHCRGSNDSVISYLSDFLESDLLEMAERIKPTHWKTLKTEAIDFSSRFLWLDDEPLISEIREMNRQGCQDRLIRVDHSQPDEFSRITAVLSAERQR